MEGFPCHPGMGRLEFPSTSRFIPTLPHGLSRRPKLAGVICGGSRGEDSSSFWEIPVLKDGQKVGTDGNNCESNSGGRESAPRVCGVKQITELGSDTLQRIRGALLGGHRH